MEIEKLLRHQLSEASLMKRKIEELSSIIQALYQKSPEYFEEVCQATGITSVASLNI